MQVPQVLEMATKSGQTLHKYSDADTNNDTSKICMKAMDKDINVDMSTTTWFFPRWKRPGVFQRRSRRPRKRKRWKIWRKFQAKWDNHNFIHNLHRGRKGKTRRTISTLKSEICLIVVLSTITTSIHTQPKSWKGREAMSIETTSVIKWCAVE